MCEEQRWCSHYTLYESIIWWNCYVTVFENTLLLLQCHLPQFYDFFCFVFGSFHQTSNGKTGSEISCYRDVHREAGEMSFQLDWTAEEVLTTFYKSSLQSSSFQNGNPVQNPTSTSPPLKTRRSLVLANNTNTYLLTAVINKMSNLNKFLSWATTWLSRK